MSHSLAGRMLANVGVVRPRSSKSCSGASIPASAAMAGMCNAAFVDPPMARHSRIAFSMAPRVMMRRAVRPRLTSSTA